MVAGQHKYYSYEALPTSTCIRLIHLHPATAYEAPLVCSVVIEDLASGAVPSYEALSYEWAPLFALGTELYPLVCNGNSCIAIRENLNDALRQLRPRTVKQPRTLWVDAICINRLMMMRSRFRSGG